MIGVENMIFYMTRDIYKEITIITKYYLDSGYWFNLYCMNGYASNVHGKIELFNGREGISIVLTQDQENIKVKDDRFMWVPCTSIEINYSGRRTYKHKTFYRISKNKYTSSADMMAKIVQKRQERENSPFRPFKDNGWHYLENVDKDKVWKIVKNRKGFTSCRKSQIGNVVRIKSDGCNCCKYRIFVEGKSVPCEITHWRRK